MHKNRNTWSWLLIILLLILFVVLIVEMIFMFFFSLDSQDEETDVFVAKEQRRFAHSAAEQKRRDAIRVSCYWVSWLSWRSLCVVIQVWSTSKYDVEVFVYDHLQFTNCRIPLHCGKGFPISSFGFALCKHRKLTLKLLYFILMNFLTHFYFIAFSHLWHFLIKLFLLLIILMLLVSLIVFFTCTWK